MGDTSSQLYGSCACQRNIYAIDIPTTSTSLASVFFDNSLQSRRQQASPLAVWLRVPLDFFHSSTIAQFPDETHSSIRRTFTSHDSRSSTTPTVRRQFCGYCGTHLTAYREAQHPSSAVIDVTLGSLFDDSLQALEALNILPDGLTDESEEPRAPQEGLVKGGSIDNETHATEAAEQEKQTEKVAVTRPHAISYMQSRGMPYFEEMIENSSLGKIKRQKGGHISEDGLRSVQWEVVEFEADEEMGDAPSAFENAAKRVKVDP